MKKLNILLLAFVAFLGITAVMSCSEDDLGDTIFPNVDKPLDRTMGTLPLDTFIKKHMLEPYNMKFIYRMEDIGADMQKNLVPASYDKSVQLAVLTKYLWLDVYKKLAGEKEVFLKKNAPRIIHVIGSAAYNDDGSRTVGVAEGGVKITLMETNKLNVNEIEGTYGLNNLFFHTMHHEFAHILDQTFQRPTAFDQISTALYDAAGWADKHDSVQCALGFVTPYGSSANREDWVEVLSCYVTWDQERWDQVLNTAKSDWEDIEFTLDSFEVRYPGAYDEQSLLAAGILPKSKYDRDSVGYLHQLSSLEYKLARKIIKRDADGYAQTDSLGNCIMDTEHWDNVDGSEVILTKLDMVRQWLKTNWDIDLDELRKEVQSRQYMTDAAGNFVRDAAGNYVNRLTQPYENNPSKTLIEYLNEEIEGYKKLYEEALKNK
jgi:substrate import-associated zinc metallohydrolase lipoprotein